MCVSASAASAVGLCVSIALIAGCQVGAAAAPEAGVRGDGIPERVVTDRWVGVVTSSTDGAAPPEGGARDGAGGAGDAGTAEDAAGACDLLTNDCPDRQGCYPFPFEGSIAGETRCAFIGAGGESVPCQSQLECNETTICSAPGEPDSVCVPRCDLDTPVCPIGMACNALAFYPGVGVCF